MIHEILPVGMLGCNCSIFGDEQSKEAMVIDPGDDIPQIAALLEKHGLKVTSIVITHAHIDHIGGAARLKSLTGAPVYMNMNDEMLYERLDIQAGWLGMAVPEKTEIDQPLKDGDTLRAGGCELAVIHTPGHTQGSSCLHAPSEKLLFAGDTLFLESIGRTDLPGGDGRQILRSINNKLFALPGETKVICGHGPSTTIEHEKHHNPFLGGR
ncbi:MAG: MBL fold metallo-hydrolase [Bryobacteraceae bacterium]|nr:MBL fold metallo-hydrolase [Bryobacteraceae bacterium]